MKAERGFVLLEVLVAVAILSGGIMVVFRAFATTLKAARVAEGRFRDGLEIEAAVWQLEQGAKTSAPPDWSRASSIETAAEEPADRSQAWREWSVRMRWDDDGDELSLRAYLPARPEGERK